MVKDGLIDNIRDSLRERRNANTLGQSDRIDRRLIKVFKSIEERRDVGLTFDAFDVVLKNTEKYHINNPEIKASTANALQELMGARETLSKVYSPETYDSTRGDHITKKRMTKEERPKDQVHDFIASHTARMKNAYRVESSDARVGLINAQVSCLRTAKKAYEKLQDKAMGREPAVKKGKDKGMER